MPAVTQIRRPLATQPTAAGLRWRAASLVAVVAVVVILICAFGGVQPQWYLPCYAALYVLAAFSVLSSQFSVPSSRLPVPSSQFPLELAVLAFLLLPLLQLASHATVDRAATATGFLALAAAAATFIAVRRLLPRQPAAAARWSERLARVLAALGGLLAFEGILQLFLSPQYALGAFLVKSAVPMGSFVNRNDFAACMGLLLPFALFLAVAQHRGRNDYAGIWWALAAALMLAATVLSASRGGVLVAAAEVAAFALWHFRHLAALSLPLGLAAVLLGGVLTYATGFHAISSRFGTQGLHDSFRIDTLESSLQMGAARPWLGYGWGTWDMVYPKYARFDDGTDPGFAHNEYAQLFAETGAAGVILGLGLLAALALAARRSAVGVARSAPATARLPLTTPAAAIALAGYAAHAALDFVFHIPALLLLAALIAGTTAMNQFDSSPTRPS